MSHVLPSEFSYANSLLGIAGAKSSNSWRQVGAFRVQIDIVFQMGIIFNFDDGMKKIHPDGRITFGDLDFIAHQFGNLQLQEPEPHVEEEQPPTVCAFFVGLEETIGAGLRALVQHLNHYGRDVFTKLGQEHDLEAILGLWEDPNWVPRSDLLSPPDHFLLGFPTGLRNATAIY